MQLNLNTREDIAREVLTTSEVIEILGITRQRLSKLVSDERIVPIKQVKAVSLFLLSDVEELKPILEANRIKYRPYDQQDS